MQHHGAALRALTDEEGLVEALAADWRTAAVSAETRALLAYAEELTLRPGEVEESDVEALRRAGWSDEAIVHACEVVSYYNFVNRTADGLGVSLEAGWRGPEIPIENDEDRERSDEGA